MRFITPTSLNSIPNSILASKLYEIIGVGSFGFSHFRDLLSRSISIRLLSNVKFDGIYHHKKFEPN